MQIRERIFIEMEPLETEEFEEVDIYGEPDEAPAVEARFVHATSY